jgi:hypothetical protein
MMKRMPIKKFLEINFSGKLAHDFCPSCGADVYEGKDKMRWCCNNDCDWSTDETLSAYIRSTREN